MHASVCADVASQKTVAPAAAEEMALLPPDLKARVSCVSHDALQCSLEMMQKIVSPWTSIPFALTCWRQHMRLPTMLSAQSTDPAVYSGTTAGCMMQQVPTSFMRSSCCAGNRGAE